MTWEQARKMKKGADVVYTDGDGEEMFVEVIALNESMERVLVGRGNRFLLVAPEELTEESA